MRHASHDAPRIKRHLFDVTLQEAVITRCATHHMMRRASGQISGWECTKRQTILWCATHHMMRHASHDAPRIGTSHFQIIKQTEGSYFLSLSPIFPLRTRLSDLVQRSDSIIFHIKRGIQVVLHRSSSSESIFYSYFAGFQV